MKASYILLPNPVSSGRMILYQSKWPSTPIVGSNNYIFPGSMKDLRSRTWYKGKSHKATNWVTIPLTGMGLFHQFGCHMKEC